MREKDLGRGQVQFRPLGIHKDRCKQEHSPKWCWDRLLGVGRQVPAQAEGVEPREGSGEKHPAFREGAPGTGSQGRGGEPVRRRPSGASPVRARSPAQRGGMARGLDPMACDDNILFCLSPVCVHPSMASARTLW